MSIVRAAPQGERRLKPISRRSPYLLIASCVAIVALVALGGSATVAAADLAPNDLELLERAARLGASGQQDAERRGEALDVDALRAMFERGEVELAARFARGMRKSAHVSLPPAVERLLVERFEQRKLVDAVLGARLEYRSRALFDLLRARLARDAPSKDSSVTWVLDTRQSGVEEQVLAMADRLPIDSVARFLARRGYRPAVPLIAAALRRDAPGSNEARAMTGALASIGDQSAADALLARIAALTSKAKEEGARKELGWLIGFDGLRQFGSDVAIDHAVVRDATIAADVDDVRSAYALLAGQRQWAEAVPVLVAMLASLPAVTRLPDGNSAFIGTSAAASAVHALAAYPDVQVWKQARDAVTRLAGEHHIDAAARDRALAILPDPQAGDAQFRVARARKALAFGAQRLRLDKLRARKEAIQSDKQWDSALFARNFAHYLNDVEALAGGGDPAAVADELREGYLALGHVTRFRLNDLDKAIAHYRRADALLPAPGSANPFDVVAIVRVRLPLADAYVHGRGDTRSARVALESVVAAIDTTGPPEADARRVFPGLSDLSWLRSAVAHEIAALEGKGRFRGRLSASDFTGFLSTANRHRTAAVWMPDVATELPPAAFEAMRASMALRGATGSERAAYRAAIARNLAALPASRYTLFEFVPLVTLMSTDKAFADLLDRSDASGYVAACLAGLVKTIAPLGMTATSDVNLRGMLALDSVDPRAALPGIFDAPATEVAALRDVADAYLKHAGASVVETDARLWTAQGVLNQVAAAMRVADVSSISAYFTPKGKTKLDRTLADMTPQQLRTAGSRMFVRAVVQNGTSDRYTATLVNGAYAVLIRDERSGEWRIDDLGL